MIIKKLNKNVLIFSLVAIFASCSSSQQIPESTRSPKKASTNANGKNNTQQTGTNNQLPNGGIISGQNGANGVTDQQNNNTLNSGQDSSVSFESALSSLQSSDVKDAVYMLASDDFAGRGTGEEGNNKAAEYISTRFNDSGIDPSSNGYFQNFDSTQNVVGVIPGSDPSLKNEVIVIGGHFDHMGKQGGSIYYGADDNASGTAAVLGAAKVLGKVKSKLRRTVVFIAFSGEEMGLLGSNHYVSNPLYPLNQTVYMINLDMVGRLKSGGLELIGGNSSSSAASVLSAVCKQQGINATVGGSTSGGSDHAPFSEHGIPVVFFHTGLHDDYHQPSDTANKVDYDGLFNVTKTASQVLWELATGDKAPTSDGYYLTTSFTDLDHGVKKFLKTLQ